MDENFWLRRKIKMYNVFLKCKICFLKEIIIITINGISKPLAAKSVTIKTLTSFFLNLK